MKNKRAIRISISFVLILALLLALTAMPVFAYEGASGNIRETDEEAVPSKEIGMFTEETQTERPLIEDAAEESGDRSETQHVSFEPQPKSMADIQAAIDEWEAGETAKPRWELEVDESLMPSGWRCDYLEDEETGIIYWTFFPAPTLMASLQNVHTVTDVSDLQTAIDNAASGDTILLADSLDGETLPSAMVINGKSLTFAAETVTVVLFPPSYAGRHITVSGGELSLTFENVILDGGYVSGSTTQYTGGIESAATVLELVNVRIQNCYAGQGGGLYVPGGARTVIISGSDTEISYNTAATYGGGVYIGGSMYMKDGDISYNKVEAVGSTATGGGIYGGNITIEGGAIHHNDVGTSSNGSRGGGIAVFRTNTLKISGGEIYENKATYGGGIFLDAYSPTGGNPHSVITGDARIYRNYACYGGGITVYNNATFAPMETEISGNVKITDNVASTEFGRLGTDTAAIGGGVFYYAYLGGSTYPGHHFVKTTISGEVEISGNTAETYGGGVAIRGYATTANTTATDVYAALTITDDVVVRGNQAPTAAGIFVWNSDLLLSGRVLVSANEATGTVGGGGIRHAPGTYDTVWLTDQVRIIGNKAEKGNGGGIYEGTRVRLFVDAEVVFADNIAEKGYAWELDGDATPGDGSASGVHMSNILTTSFTAPFTNAYNNFDIGYIGATPVYTVTFYDEDGLTVLASFAVDQSDGITAVASYPEGETSVAKPDDPAKQATAEYRYEFAEWIPGSGAYTIASIEDPVTQNMAFTASYRPTRLYTLTVLADAGGIADASVNGSYAEGEVITLAATSDDGYRFNGWTSDNGGSFADTASESTTFTMPAVDVTVTASFTESYTVTYDANGGTGGHRDTELEADSEYTVRTLDGTEIVRDGYTFEAWNTAADSGGTAYAPGDIITITGDVTLYAQWNRRSSPITPPGDKDKDPEPTSEPESDKETTSDGHEIGVGSGREDKNPYDTIVIIGEELSPLGFLESDDHIRYLNGYPDVTVRPEQNITRAEAAAIFFRLLSDDNKFTGSKQAFPDVPADAWYSRQINYLADLGIITGYPDGTFRPDAPITRAEFAAIASRFDNLILTTGTAFADVPEDHWAVQYINSDYIKSWIDGYKDYSFKPEQHITRAEVVKIVNTMLTRLPETLPDGINPYTDIDESHWAYIHMMEASIEHDYGRDDLLTEYWTEHYERGDYLL